MQALDDQTVRTLRAAVDRVLSSVCFQRSHRLYELLNYLAEQTSRGDAESLKESVNKRASLAIVACCGR